MAVEEPITNLFSSFGSITKKLLVSDDIQFALLFILLFFLALGFIKVGLKRTDLFKDNERQANVVAITIAGLLCLGLFVGVRDPVAQVKAILGSVRAVGSVIIGIGSFMAFRASFKDLDFMGHELKNHISVFALGLGLWFAGSIANYDESINYGSFFISISIVWLLWTLLMGGRGDNKLRSTKEKLILLLKKWEKEKEDENAKNFNDECIKAKDFLEKAAKEGFSDVELNELKPKHFRNATSKDEKEKAGKKFIEIFDKLGREIFK